MPPIAYLHQSTKLELVIRNYHPSRSAHPYLHLEITTSESFIVSGLRTGRLPILLPGTEESIVWNLIPIECGNKLPIPKFRVVDRRGVDSGDTQEAEVEGAEVEIVDMSWGSPATSTLSVTNTRALAAGEGTESSAEDPAGAKRSREGKLITISVRPGVEI